MSSLPGHQDPRALVVLTEGECYRLLAGDTFGRVVFTRRAMPAIVPVNYLLDGRDILLRTDPKSQLGRAIDATIVAFEVDGIDRSSHTGWSVVVVGTAHALEDDAGPREIRTVEPDPWAPGARTLLVRITPGAVTGRKLTAPAPAE